MRSEFLDVILHSLCTLPAYGVEQLQLHSDGF